LKEGFYEAPQSLDEALEVLDRLQEKATILAGATDIMPRINDGVFSPEYLVYIGNTGLTGIRREKDSIIIGATTTLTQIEENSLIAQHAPVLTEAVRNMAGVSIRNMGTIGGNICNASPAADTATPLLVLDAEVAVMSRRGKRIFPIDEFFYCPGKTCLNPNEMITEIILPIKPHCSAFLKLGQRKAEVLSIVGVSVKLVNENGICKEARIAMGSVAPRPIRCCKAEAFLTGKEITPILCHEAAVIAGGAAKPIDDGRATAWYRKRLAPVMVERALKKAMGFEEEETAT